MYATSNRKLTEEIGEILVRGVRLLITINPGVQEMEMVRNINCSKCGRNKNGIFYCDCCGEKMKKDNPEQETKYKQCDVCEESKTVEYEIKVRKLDQSSPLATLYCCHDCASNLN